MRGYRFQVIVYSLFFVLLFTVTCPLSTAHAIVDPLSVPNNKFGIHIISASKDEASPAAELVNSNGDWGYITFLIEAKFRDQKRWQEFFNYLREKHLIPIVRLATEPEENFWKRPYEGEEQAWADFLGNLNWPTKNRYIIIYNEPNHGSEWGNQVDAASYARVLDKTIDALKKKNPDFFVLNAGLDASAPQELPNYENEVLYLQQMEQAIPGILSKLDGWVSHSYPNPGFVGSSFAVGRGTIRTYIWEQQVLRSLGIYKSYPIFITETGWKHAEGLNYDPFLPSSDQVANYYQQAFNGAWNNSQIVAVTPFLLNYQQTPFDHFSFKKITGITYPFFYPQYQVLKDFPKILGQPSQENLAQLIKGEIYSSIVVDQTYIISLKLRNTGQSIWNPSAPFGRSGQVKLKAIEGGNELGIKEVEVDKEVEPSGYYAFQINLKAPQKGVFKVKLNLFSDSKEFDSNPIEFTTEVKEPVILQIFSKLKWKASSAGKYILRVSGEIGDSTVRLEIDENGKSKPIEAKYLLLDYSFDFSLEKPFYYPKTIHKQVNTGENILDFGELQPEFLNALLHPGQFWKLLPFSK